MKKSIFFRYFTTCVTIILLSIIFLGSSLAIFAVRYSNGQKQSLYFSNAAIVSQIVADAVDNSPTSSSLIDIQVMRAVMISFSRSMEADMFITRSDGKTWITTESSGNPRMDTAVPSGVMTSILNGKKYSAIGNLGGTLNSVNETVGVPITLRSGQVIGGVFVYARAGSILHFVADIIRIFLICAVFVLILSFIIIYFVTAKLVRPLRDMSAAAKSFGNGDFSKRVPVHNNDEIGQLAFAFNNMANSLSTLEDMRRGFVANVSHELKTPMTSIAGFIDGILDGTIPEEKREYYLKIVSEEVKRLSRLVHSMLEISKIEAGEIRINYSQFDVMETLRRVIIGFERQIDDKHLEITGLDMEARVMVSSDADLTHQIIYNLVENAVKFSNSGGGIELNVAERDKKVYVSVKNTGMGIPAQDLPYIFDRFYKTDKSRGLDKKGIGLGLYIVKSILNLQGEDITAKSEEGKYCQFVFTLKKG